MQDERHHRAYKPAWDTSSLRLYASVIIWKAHGTPVA